MNVQYYVAAFDQALWQMLLRLGFSSSWIQERQEGWVDVRHVIEYRAELQAGNLFEIDSALQRIGNTSLTTFHRLRNTAADVVSAELEATTVFFDLAARKAKPIPGTLRNVAQKMMIS